MWKVLAPVGILEHQCKWHRVHYHKSWQEFILMQRLLPRLPFRMSLTTVTFSILNPGIPSSNSLDYYSNTAKTLLQ